MTMSRAGRGLLLALVTAFCLPAFVNSNDPQSDPRPNFSESASELFAELLEKESDPELVGCLKALMSLTPASRG